MCDKPLPLSEDEYRNAFGLNNPTDKRAEKALECALEIRKFEIGLYWERAKYFWALIASSFAGYFALRSAKFDDPNEKAFVVLIVACVGFVASVAWFYVNRGSKYWQENWENHVSMLEDSIMGPLYKTTLSRPTDNKYSAMSKFISGPLPMSVSKINQIVSLFVICIWLILILQHLGLHFPTNSIPINAKTMIVAFTLGTCGVIRWSGRTNPRNHRHYARKRSGQIVP